MSHDHHHQPSHDAPIVRDMSALTGEQKRRYRLLARKLAAAVAETRELDRGYALKLAEQRLSLPEAGEWMLLEGKCCPFLEIAMESQSGALVITLAGREGVKAFLKRELAI